MPLFTDIVSVKGREKMTDKRGGIGGGSGQRISETKRERAVAKTSTLPGTPLMNTCRDVTETFE